MFLVFISWEESQLNSPRIYFSFNTAICTEMKFSAAPSSSENHNTYSVDRLRLLNKPLETKESLLSHWHSTLRQIPVVAIPILRFLTATHSQVTLKSSWWVQR
jgi:hypothetical protein